MNDSARTRTESGPALLCSDGSGDVDRAVQRAATLLQPRRAAAIHVSWRGLEDDVAGAILEEAHDRGASVIVVGSHGARALLDRSDVPVLVAGPVAAPSPASEPILICYDGSDIARDALATAAQLLAGRAAIVAAFVPALDDTAVLRSALPWPVGGETEDWLARVGRQEAERPFERAVEGARSATLAGFAAQPLAIAGVDASADEEENPWQRLLRAAAAEEAACIVVGHRWSAKRPESTAHGLVQHADRPVLVVPGERASRRRITGLRPRGPLRR